jgi:hypothetical protein
LVSQIRVNRGSATPVLVFAGGCVFYMRGTLGGASLRRSALPTYAGDIYVTNEGDFTVSVITPGS